MLTLNTNLSSIITQTNLTNSTNNLNKAIEQLTTGFKINHAGDNAANYNISTNMSTKISAYQVAEDNVSMGLDLLSTANDILSSMQDKAARLSALSTQARNGTYGSTSLSAINTEANAIIAELMRDYNNAQYNNISLFNKAFSSLPDDAPRAGESGFIDESAMPSALKAKETGFIDDIVEETPQITVTDPTQLASAISSYTKIGIGNAETLAKLAELVNSGTSCSGKTIILTDDIDLSAYENWTPIGTSSKYFGGTFNGNGHVVRNLTINRPTESNVGLFGYNSGALKNIGVENANINGKSNVGGLVGITSSSITNSYATGNVTGQGYYVGGLVGSTYSSITNSYATGNVTGQGYYVGGLVGSTSSSSSITNSYATGNVTGQDYVGGLAGDAGSSITNSYATGNVTGNNDVGGLAGIFEGESSTNSYATGNISGNKFVGGLVGSIVGNNYECSVTQCYSLGKVTGNESIGSFIGATYYYNDMASGVELDTINCYSAKLNTPVIGGTYVYEWSDDTGSYTFTEYEDSNLSDWLDNITLIDTTTTLQVGVQGDDASRITTDTNFIFNFASFKNGMENASTFDAIQEFNNLLSQKQTDLGAIQNRLESALEEIATNYDNLVSSRSTLRDADVAEVSAKYIQQQILQQASATLLATANQSPAIALQLI